MQYINMQKRKILKHPVKIENVEYKCGMQFH